MKREFISNLLPDISKEHLDAIMAEHGKDIEAEKALTATETTKLKTANDTIKNLQDAAKAFEGVDVNDLKGQIKTLQDKYDQDIAKLKLDTALDAALRESKARNIKAVRALLNMEEIKLDGDKLLGLDTQLEAAKKSDAYLFGDDSNGGDPPPDGNQNQNQNGTGIRFSSGNSHGGGNHTEDYDKMSDEEYYAAMERAKQK